MVAASVMVREELWLSKGRENKWADLGVSRRKRERERERDGVILFVRYVCIANYLSATRP